MNKSIFKRLKKYIYAVLGLVFSAFIIYLLSKKINFNVALENLRGLSIMSVILLITTYLSTFFIRALRWKLMFEDKSVSYFTYLNCMVIGFAGNNFLPARGGELLRMEFFKRQSNINRITGLSSIFIEKILDGLVLVSFLLIIANLDETLIANEWIKRLILFSTLLFSFFLFLILIFRKFGNRLIQLLESSKKLIQSLAFLLRKVQDSTSFLRWNKNTLLIFLLSILVWLIEGFVFVFALYIFDLNEFAVVAGYLSLVIVNFGILIPSSPGYFGLFQGMTILSLMLFGVNKEIALSISILVHFCQYIPVTLWGVFYIVKSSISRL